MTNKELQDALKKLPDYMKVIRFDDFMVVDIKEAIIYNQDDFLFVSDCPEEKECIVIV